MYFIYTTAFSWIILLLGIVNIVTGLLLYFSCRCVSRLPERMKNPAFARYYRFHCHLWKIFWPSVSIHALLATARFILTI